LTDPEIEHLGQHLPHLEHVLTAGDVLVDAPTDQATAVRGRHLGELGMGEDATALPAPVIPRPVFRDPSLNSVPEVLQVDDPLGNATDPEEILAVAGWASLAGQFDHLVDPEGVPGLLPVLGPLELRVGPGEDLVPLVIEVGTLVHVSKAREARVLCP